MLTLTDLFCGGGDTSTATLRVLRANARMSAPVGGAERSAA
ncbi:hypothetical protein [Streptomyces sp. SYP-A7185]